MLLSLLMRFSSVARERMQFTEWSCNISQTKVSCGRSMACAQWIWNTQGLTVCPIEDLLDVNHLTWEGTESPVCPESAVGLCLYTDDLCCGLCETPWYASNPWMALCRLWQWFLEISHRHLKLTSSYLDFLLPPLCLEKSACMVTICLYCGYLQGNKHTEWSLHSVTFGFLFLLYFVYKTISVKNFCQMCVCFFFSDYASNYFKDICRTFRIQLCRIKNYSRHNSRSQCTQCISQATCDNHMHCL